MVNLTVGHTTRPLDSEIAMWSLHLKAAGFMDKARSDSPSRQSSKLDKTNTSQQKS